MRLLIVAAIAGCSVPTLDYTGKSCPCPGGYVCDVQNTCTRIAADASNSDGTFHDGPGDGHGLDGQNVSSCLSNTPLTTLAYSTTTFSDFGGSSWSTVGGSWTAANNDLSETVAADFAVAYRTVASPTNNYRLVATMARTSGGDGQALELALRLDASMGAEKVYHCNWEPTDYSFLIMHTDSAASQGTIDVTTVDVSGIVGYTSDTPVTMEFQVVGNTLTCCLQGIAGATLAGSSTLYSSGAVGFKTYEMTGVYSNFSVYIP